MGEKGSILAESRPSSVAATSARRSLNSGRCNIAIARSSGSGIGSGTIECGTAQRSVGINRIAVSNPISEAS